MTTTNRIYNFNAGPAVLPEEVLEEVRDNILSYGATGIGILEQSHRGAAFEGILAETEASLRELLRFGESHAILFCTGGATTQFSMVPLNLRPEGATADYILTGAWSEKAAEEAKRFGRVHVAADSGDRGHSYIPASFAFSDDPAYVHFTSNNTIFGTQWRSEPDAGGAPLACDASSDLLHKAIDVDRYGLIYAGAQKNLGPAGMTLVIVRKTLLERSPKNLPIMLDYNIYAKHRSLYNTPPTFAIYVFCEVLRWLRRTGGLDEMERRNREKAGLIYDAIDRSGGFYRGHAETESRSLMNVTFRLARPELEPVFAREALASGMSGLEGHRSVGGLRASIYNAFPRAGAQALADFMKEFARKHG